ncbi:unnamed protein product [Rotaria socialis]|uniref:Metallo-beta-lactamase domain-containing protein n=2 Tax=Rotaria socialis TaxID=392032 RepID=A0A820TXY5_9BILA|nr:unnamed protein product [Rotaria socialis]CAF4557022.1 unnamed protein product [Rotaria socialis]
MIMLILSIILLLLISFAGGTGTITLDSLLITQVQDTSAPKENSNAYIVTSMISRQGFFVDAGSSNDISHQLISIYQQQVQSTSKPPQFVFITHGHPDHIGSIALIQQLYPSTPIYLISQQAIKEAIQWIDLYCRNNIYSTAQCAVDYTKVLRTLTSPRTQLIFDHPSVRLNTISNVIKGESSYAGLLSLTTSSNNYFLFTGDSITIRSHMFISNFFDTEKLPSSDDALCAWAGSMQESVCTVKLGGRKPIILPGHGTISTDSSYAKDVVMNITWLRLVRRLTFNSCNATFIWAEMVRQYPDFAEASIGAKGALNTHVPADANSVNCNCVNGLPTICPVYHEPPSCLHLDRSDSQTTLACDMQ